MKTGQSGSPMVPMHMGRNAHQWNHVATFLADLAGTAAKSDGGKRSAPELAASSSVIPDGNHGDNNFRTVPGDRS